MAKPKSETAGHPESVRVGRVAVGAGGDAVCIGGVCGSAPGDCGGTRLRFGEGSCGGAGSDGGMSDSSGSDGSEDTDGLVEGGGGDGIVDGNGGNGGGGGPCHGSHELAPAGKVAVGWKGSGVLILSVE